MLVISKDIVTLEYFEGDELQKIVIDHENNTLTKYMDHSVAITDGVTVRDLFKHLSKEKNLINTVFDSSLGGYELDLYLAELDIPDKDDNILKYAIFEHKAELVDDSLISDIRFSAVGIHPENSDVNVSYTLELSGINMYADLPVVIDDSYIIWATINDDENEHEEVAMLDCQKPMTFYDIISSLLYEVSYHGTPEMRTSILEEIKKHILGNDQGEMMTKGLKEIIKDLENRLEKSLHDEDYETSAEIRDKINELKNKKIK